MEFLCRVLVCLRTWRNPCQFAGLLRHVRDAAGAARPHPALLLFRTVDLALGYCGSRPDCAAMGSCGTDLKLSEQLRRFYLSQIQIPNKFRVSTAYLLLPDIILVLISVVTSHSLYRRITFLILSSTHIATISTINMDGAIICHAFRNVLCFQKLRKLYNM